jgi:hypothetical protein
MHIYSHVIIIKAYETRPTITHVSMPLKKNKNLSLPGYHSPSFTLTKSHLQPFVLPKKELKARHKNE